MSFINASPGDVQYANYAVIDTIPIKAAVNIEKGNCYTIDGEGFLLALTGASGALTNLNGIFQAMAKTNSISGEVSGSRRVQCLQKRSRVVLKAPANITKGDTVSIDVSGTTVTANKVQAATTHIIGTVFEIIAITTSRIPKVKTENDDLILVDLLE